MTVDENHCCYQDLIFNWNYVTHEIFSFRDKTCRDVKLHITATKKQKCVASFRKLMCRDKAPSRVVEIE